MKKNKTLLIVLVLVILGIGVFCIINKNDNDKDEIVNNEQIETNENMDYDNSIEKELQEEGVKKITISDEEILNIFIDVEPFDNEVDLSTDEKLAIVYEALNKNKIEAYKSRKIESTKVEYTEGEINGIVYSLFGVVLSENKSYKNVFIYENGKYTLVRSDSKDKETVAKDIERDVAAGTVYMNYKLYYKTSSGEEYKGTYAIGKSNINSFVTCKKKM